MSLIIPRITDRVLPIPPLPNAGLPLAHQRREASHHRRHRPRKQRLDHLPPSRDVMIIRRQGPKAMHVIWQHHPSIDMKRMPQPRRPNRAAQSRDFGNQQIRAPIHQIDRKEIRPAIDAVAGIIRHHRKSPMRRRQTPRPATELFRSSTGASNRAPSTALVG